MKVRIENIFFVLLLIFFWVFFSNIHPIMPHDTDDWIFMSSNRLAIPSTIFWNPTRVLPELLLPLVSDFAAYFIYPITNDYFNAQIITHGFFVAFIISIYALVFYRVLINKFHFECLESILLTVVFLLVHFMVFRRFDSENQHLFYSHDLTCYYFYTIPNILSSLLILSLLNDDWIKSNSYSWTIRGLLFASIYLVLLSNLYSSNLFVIFIACKVLVEFVTTINNKNGIGILSFIKQYVLHLIIIITWLFINLFEVLGERASYQYARNNETSVSFADQLGSALRTMSYLPGYINKSFVLLVFIAICYFVLRHIRYKTNIKIHLVLILTSILSCIYVYLVSAKVNPFYLIRSDVTYPFIYPLLLLIFLFFVEITQKNSWAKILLPLATIVLFTHINTSDSTFKDIGTTDDCRIDRINRVNTYIYNQFVSDWSNEDSLYIKVPYVNDELNWPYMTYSNKGYEAISNTLYKHGIIRYKKPGKFVKDKPFNEY